LGEDLFVLVKLAVLDLFVFEQLFTCSDLSHQQLIQQSRVRLSQSQISLSFCLVVCCWAGSLLVCNVCLWLC